MRNAHALSEAQVNAVLRQPMLGMPAANVVVFDCQMRIQQAHGPSHARHGYDPELLIGLKASDILPAVAWEQLEGFYARALAGETLTIDYQSSDGLAVYESSFGPVEHEGQIIGGIALSREVTVERAEAAAAHRLIEAIFDSAPIGKFVSRRHPDGSTEVVRCNQAFARLLGLNASDIVGHAIPEFMHPDDLPIRERFIEALLSTGSAHEEVRFRHIGGDLVWAYIAGASTPGVGGDELYVVQAVDITDRKRLERRLRYVADHDLLTGLLSRRAFTAALREAILAADGLLLLIDLDGFKELNDSAGHAAGDDVLAAIGQALRYTVGPEDVTARIGGDEFAVILRGAGEADSREAAERVLEAIRSAGLVPTESGMIGVTASIGAVALDDPQVSSDVFLARADARMYGAKRAGKDQLAIRDR